MVIFALSICIAMHRPVVGLRQGRRRERNSMVEIKKFCNKFQENLVMTRPPVRESTIPGTGMDKAVTGMHCSSKHDEFTARVEGDGVVHEIVRRLA